jgi:aerobic-type carbon monoxide dehydrogenase small subunit (CoxS/CutS family)
MLLSDFLRQELGRPEVHVGCEHGVCGVCTVLIDGKPARSCLTFAVQAAGRRVDTVRGLADKDGKLNDLQNAFRKHHGLQCGYCTPGLMLSTYQLLSENPDPDEKQIRHAIAGNTCRCTGYMNVFKAIRQAGRNMKGA